MTQTKKTRGKGVKPALDIVAVRLPPDTLAYYKKHHTAYTSKMREVLVKYVEYELTLLGLDNVNSEAQTCTKGAN